MVQTSPITFSKYHSKFVVGVLDIVHSTETTMRLSGEKIDDFYTIFLQDISKVIAQYDGQVIKNIGDGVLFYFPATIDMTPIAFEQVVHCARALLGEREDINQKLTDVELPAISYRISMSFGPISVILDEQGKINDLFGATVNTCSKINKLAKPDTCIVGEALYQQLLPLEISMEKVGDYTIENLISFGVFEVKNK